MLGKGLGYHCPLALAVAECVDAAVGKTLNACESHCLVDDVFVVGGETSPKSGIWAAPEGDKFADGHVLYRCALGEDNTNFPCELTFAVAIDVFPVEEYLSGELGLEGGECLEQRRFTYTIGSQQTGELSVGNGGVDMISYYRDRLVSSRITYG